MWGPPVKGIESIIISPQYLHAKPIRIVMEMVTAKPKNANAWLIMSMTKIARIMDVSTYYMYRNNLHFLVLNFSKSSTDGP